MTLHSSRFGPSLHRYRAATTASADCCTSIPTPLDVSSPMADVQLSQGNARDLHVVSVGYTWRCSVQVLGITALCLLTPPPRLYPLPVRRTNTLPAASFRSRITPDTLAVRLPLPLAGCGGGLAPPKSPSHHHVGSDSASHGAARHAWRTKKGRGLTSPGQSGGFEVHHAKSVTDDVRFNIRKRFCDAKYSAWCPAQPLH